MAEKCPYCGSTDLTTTGVGIVEKAVEAPVTMVLAGVGQLGRALKTGNTQGPSGFVGKIVGNVVDAVCLGTANSITKNIPTGRKCNKCGRTFHSTPDKGWYEDQHL